MHGSGLISEVRRLERDLLRGRTFHHGDYDFDHAGLESWQPDWASFDMASQRLGDLKVVDGCTDELRSIIDRLIRSARNAQIKASEEVRQGQVIVSSQPLTSETFDEVLTYQSILDELLRNDPCPCGSGKQHKNCHGRPPPRRTRRSRRSG
jgi:hypothetical protein